MAYPVEHTVTVLPAKDFMQLVRMRDNMDTVTPGAYDSPPWGMDYIIGTRSDGTKSLQAIKASATEWTIEDLQNYLSSRKIPGEITGISELGVMFSDHPSIIADVLDDGTHAIRHVPIFELGEHRDFDYTEEWADTAIANFEADKAESGFRPTVIVGHNDSTSAEKPAVGFFDNITRVGTTLYADLVNIGDELFAEIKAGAWPYRSVEVLKDSMKFTALALLGSHTPFFKFPALAFGDTPEAAEIIRYEESDTQPIINQPIKTAPTVGANYQKGDDPMSEQTAPTPGVSEEQFKELQAQIAAERAKAAEAEAKFTASEAKAAAQIAALSEDARQRKLTEFSRNLNDLGYAPAVVQNEAFTAYCDELSRRETTVKFSETDTATDFDAFGRLLNLFAAQHKEKALFVEAPRDTAQTQEAAKLGDKPAPNTTEEVAAIDAFMAENKIEKFEEARDAYRAQEGGR